MAMGAATCLLAAICICLCGWVNSADVQAFQVNVTFYPAKIKALIEESVENITLQYTWNDTVHKRIKMTVTSNNIESVVVHGNSTFILDSSDFGLNATVIQVRGVFIDKTGITVTFKPEAPTVPVQPFSVDYSIGVIRKPSVLDTIFIVSVSVMVGLNTIGFGCKLDLEVVKEILKKPIAPAIGFLCQYTIMPLASYALGKIVDLPAELSFGLFVIGACPGGGASNVWSVLLDGDISLSLTMTFFSVVAALGMLPLWLYTLGVTILNPDEDIKIPFDNIATSIITLVVPCIVGVLINRFLPKVGKVLSKCVKPASFIIVLFIVSFGTYANLYIFFMLKNWKITVSGILLPYTGMVVSGFVAFVCRRKWYRIKTIMFETAVQSTGVAILITKLSLPQPEADLAAVMPVTSTMFTPVPMLIWFISLTIYRKCCKKPLDSANISIVTVDDEKSDQDRSSMDKEPEQLENGKSNGAIELGDIDAKTK